MTAETRLLSDDPVDGSAEAPDLLYREQYVDHVVTLLDQVRSQGPSSVLSLIADWGAGKSSIVNMIKGRLSTAGLERARWLVAEFNPWIYSDLESLIYGFFAELREALPKEDQWKTTRESLGAFGKQVAPIGKLGGLIGLDLSGMAEAAAKIISGDTSASAVQAKAEEALRESDRPILMILDDLDRLAPDELLLVFKLVRLIGRLPNVYYLLCYDEQTLLDTLSRSALVGGCEARARDYMEKMVQVRVDVPPLREVQQDTLVNSAILTIADHHNVQARPDEGNRFFEAYQGHLRSRLRTPRAINRFFAQADAFYGALQEEVDFVDYLLMTYLRTAEPGVYKLLQGRKLQLTGTVSSDPLARRVAGTYDFQTWKNDLVGAGVDGQHADGIMNVLAVLFAPIQALRDGANVNRTMLADIGRRRGVGHEDYFDRYFAFGVPAEDIADSVVSRAMEELASDSPGEATPKLSESLVSDTQKVVRKISALADARTLPAGPLAQLLADRFAEIPSGNIFTTRPDLSVVNLTCELLREIPDAATGTALLAAMAANDGGLRLVIHTIRLIRQNPRSGDGIAPPSWLAEARGTVESLITARLVRATSEPLDDLPNRLFKELIWRWHDLDAAGVKDWLREQVSNGTWDLVKLLAKYVTFTEHDGQMLPQSMLGDLNSDEVNELFDLPYVFEQLGAQIDSATEVNRFAPVTSPDQAEQYVLWILKNDRGRVAQPGLPLPAAEPSEGEPDQDGSQTADDGVGAS